MLADSIFEQGVTHDVCEDYALHGDGYAIVSDGCSSGSHTDWGSRLITKAAEQHLHRQRQHAMQFYQAVGGTVLTQTRSFINLPDTCLTATLMTVQQIGDVFKVFAMGDGVIGGKRKDGRWKIHVIEFTGPIRRGAPYYLKYDIYGETDEWLEKCGGNYEVTTYFGNIMSPKIEYPIEAMPSFEQRCADWEQIVTETVNEKEFDKECPFEEFEFPVDEYEFVFITSDGSESFYERRITESQKYNEDIHVLDALRVLLDFRSFPPGFMHLQRSWAFKQDRKGTFKNRNWKNTDDVSIGVLYCGK